jgi:hypothetical protein
MVRVGLEMPSRRMTMVPGARFFVTRFVVTSWGMYQTGGAADGDSRLGLVDLWSAATLPQSLRCAGRFHLRPQKAFFRG